MTTPSPTSTQQDHGPDLAADGPPMPPMPFEPEADQVAGPDTEIMYGVVLDYTYSGGRHYRLLFDHEHHVTFEMPGMAEKAKAAGVDAAQAKAPTLNYRARELKPGLVLVHWIVKPAAIHVALTIDLEDRKLHVGAMMPPNRWEFFDTAVINSVTHTEK